MCNMVRAIFLLMASWSVINIEAKSDFPPYITVCKRDSDVSQCVLKNIDACKPHLKEGIPALKIPPLDPLTISDTKIDNGDIKIIGKDFKISNLYEFEVLKIDVNVDKDTIMIKLRFPKLEGRGKYSISGKILVLELDGSGDSYGNLTKVEVEVTVKGQRKTKNGKEFLDLTETKLNLEIVGDVYLYFDNLFAGREDLTKATNEVINENGKDFIAVVKPVIEKSIGLIISQIIRQLFDKFSIDELFPK